MLEPSMHLLRTGDFPEWEEFRNRKFTKELTTHFNGHKNEREFALQLRQYEVKQDWQVLLNGKELGMLVRDISNMIIYFSVPPLTLTEGENVLQVIPLSNEGEDILVGEIILYEKPVSFLLTETILDVRVTGEDNRKALPCRLTIVNEKGILQTFGAKPGPGLAIRPGNIYAMEGRFSIGLPAGHYKIYAGRGFEYSIDSFWLTVKRGERIQKSLTLSKEVNTDGWIRSDTHIHSYTYSGHGDASIIERTVTIAGEGIELPVMTDHNIHVDLERLADSMKTNRFYTPVNGIEFTTNLGHFNVFPFRISDTVPNPELRDWNDLRTALDPGNNRVIILNHARDIHNNFRPFDPKNHLAGAGKDLNGWNFPANAMEVMNSGSLQTDDSRLFHDWMGMMNRGIFLTPVGSSDSHDVSRYLVGQARTYIRSNTDQPDQINRDEIITNFREGKVAVSMGLLTEMTVNEKYGAGELSPSSEQIKVTVSVKGPGWIVADRVTLYANGKKIREATIKDKTKAGVKWKHDWLLPKFKQDVFLVAMAEGPYHYLPFWPLVRPFQPRSTVWNPKVMGVSGAIRIAGDGDGRFSCAYKYAVTQWQRAQKDISRFIQSLGHFDEAVAVQAASVLFDEGWKLNERALELALMKGKPFVRQGFEQFRKDLRKTAAESK
jgi:hypothetical protein